MKRYRHLFFDLDHTLWDFTANSRATLKELFDEQDLISMGVPDAGSFIEVYEEVNLGLWGRYESGHIPKQVLRVLRFRNTLRAFGVKSDRMATYLGHAYVERCPQRGQLMPGTLELLEDLHGDHRLHVITNGFDEVQQVKLKSSGLSRFFDVVLTSEKAGARKPDLRIFEIAMKRARVGGVSECLMIGDNALADMGGARNAGWDHVHYAAEAEPDPLATFRVRHMDELRGILLDR